MTFKQSPLKEISDISKHFGEHSTTKNILNHIQKHKSEYPLLYPRLYSSFSVSQNQFLETVLIGAMLFDLSHPIPQSDIEQHNLLLKKMCALFKITALSELSESNASKYLACLTHFITVINKKNPELHWSQSHSNEEIMTMLSRLIFNKENIAEQVALEHVVKHSVTANLDEYLKRAFESTAAVQKTTRSSLFSWFYSANSVDVARANAAQFITTIATSIQTSFVSVEEKERLSHQDVLALQNTILGAMVYELIHLTRLAPNEYETKTNCPLAKGLFDCLAIEALTDIDESELSTYLNALSDYIQQHPDTRWHKTLDNHQIREEIQQRQGVIVGTSTVQSLTAQQ